MIDTDTLFSEREQAFIRLIARGYDVRTAAGKLGCSVQTARNIAALVRAKAHVHGLREVPLAYWQLTGNNPYPQSPDAPTTGGSTP